MIADAEAAIASMSLWLPFVGSLLGASVPALLTALVYPMQRRADRMESLHVEKRSAYRQYLETVGSLALESSHAEHGDDPVLSTATYHQYSTAAAMLRLFGPETIVDAADKVGDLALNPNAVRTGSFGAERRHLTVLMRNDLFSSRVGKSVAVKARQK